MRFPDDAPPCAPPWAKSWSTATTRGVRGVRGVAPRPPMISDAHAVSRVAVILRMKLRPAGGAGSVAAAISRSRFRRLGEGD